jgi:hypothetical protein
MQRGGVNDRWRRDVRVNLPTRATLAAFAVDAYRAAPAGEIVDVREDRFIITRQQSFNLLAGRGTANFAGWASDFLIAPRVLKTHPQWGPGEQGFVDGAALMWVALKPRLDPAVPIVMSVHSRAAGMAPWLAAEALADGYTVLYVLGLETPWTAGPDLISFITARGVQGIQTINGNDPVPDVPPLHYLRPNVWPILRIGTPMAWPIACHSVVLVAADLAALEAPRAPTTEG